MTNSFDSNTVKACVFDVFGTVVDWRGSIKAEGEARCEVPHLWRGEEICGSKVQLRARVELGIEPCVVRPRVEVASGERQRR